MKNFISDLEKGELHVHLNGLISTTVIQDIIIQESIEIPKDFNLKRDLLIEQPADNLHDYLKPWEVLRLIPTKRDSLRVLMLNAFANLKQQNISFVEIRNSIVYLSFLNNISVNLALQWLLEEMEYASDKYQIKAGLIMTISRGDYSLDNFNVLIKAYEEIGKPSLVVGLDLAGNEDIEVSNGLGSLFRNAKDKYGFGITIHAGETGKKENIREAIEFFGADRIGHGTAAGKDIETMSYLKAKNICIEVCPISNRLTGAVKEEDYHPLVEFIKHDVPFVLCSDNPAIHTKTLNDDYLSFYNECGRKDILQDMINMQKKYTFIKD